MTLTKTAILGSAFGYRIEQLEAFLRSCHAALPHADVFIFTDQSGRKALETAKGYCANCKLITPSGTRRRMWLSKLKRGSRLLSDIQLFFGSQLKHIRNNSDRHSSLVTGAFGVAIARYLWYQEWIGSDEAHRYQNILLCDTRDVVFQRDPFQGILQDELWCGEEPILMGDCQINRAWYTQAYGKSEFDRIATFPVLCSGVTGGTTTQITDYLAAMCAEILRVGYRIVRGNGYDQAVHNHVIRFSNLATQIRLCDSQSEKLVTLHYMREDALEINADMEFLTKQGKPVAVVHQYDRHPTLTKAVQKRFCATP